MEFCEEVRRVVNGPGLPLDTALIIFLAGSFLLTSGQVPWGLKAAATLLLLLYLVVSHFGATGEESEGGRRARRVYRVKLGIVLGLVLCLAVAPTLSSILTRHTEGPETNAHDGVLQIEAAISFLVDGQNPYAVTYEDTPLGAWRWGHPYPNPALYYLAYLPVMFLSGVPLWALSEAALGWYDQRFLYLLAYVVALWAWHRLARDRTSGLIALAVVGLNPLTLPYFIEGRNDIVIVALLGLSLLALSRAESRWGLPLSGVFFGIACAAKQSIWFFGPFYLLYVWRSLRSSGGSEGQAARVAIRRWLLPGAFAAILFILPFFLWSPASFLEDTVSYLSGNVEHNYPIKTRGAYGLHVLLASPGFAWLLDSLTSGPLKFLRPLAGTLKITSELQPYPFWIFQTVFALPVVVLALRKQLRGNTVALALAGYALTLLVYQYFSRFLHDNYIGYIVTVWALAYLIREPLEQPVSPRDVQPPLQPAHAQLSRETIP